MPTGAPYVCAVPTCRQPGCTAHRKQPFRGHVPSPKRVTGERLQRLRMALWERQQGRCAACHRVCLPSDMERDHIVNLKEGGDDIEANCQMLCKACHKTKTEAEAKRGMARNR